MVNYDSIRKQIIFTQSDASKRTVRQNDLSIYLREDVKQYSKLTPEERESEIKRIYAMRINPNTNLAKLNEDIDLFAKRNIGLVFQRTYKRLSKVSRLGLHPTASPLDLIQEGYVALLDAIVNFDPGRDFKFSTYACKCIDGVLSNYLRDNEHIIRISRHVRDSIKKILKVKEELTAEYGRTPEMTEIAKKIGVHESTVRCVLELKFDSLFEEELTTPIADKKDQFERIFEPDRQELESKVKSAVESLSGIEKEVLTSVYGLYGKKPELMTDIAKRTRYTPQGISLIAKRACAKLAKKKGLKELL